MLPLRGLPEMPDRSCSAMKVMQMGVYSIQNAKIKWLLEKTGQKEAGVRDGDQ